MSPEPSTSIHLTLVRHGQTDWNDAATVQGQRDDARLTELGRQQARNAGLALRGEHFDAIITSDLARARESAAIIAEALELPVESTSALRERCFGVAEGHPVAALVAHETGIDGARVVDVTAHSEGGESMNDVYERTTKFVTRLAVERPGQRIVLVTHGGAIQMIRALASGVPVQGLEWDPVVNCSIWPLDLELD